MSGWGIAPTAPEIEKIKAESADYLHGLNSCGVIDWGTYNTAFDFYMSLLDKAYEQGKKDAKDAQPDLDEWCTDCKEYDKERHCCPRWNRVIRETVEEWKSNQSEIIHCGDCRHWKNNHLCECLSRYGTFETEIYFYCGFAERREE